MVGGEMVGGEMVGGEFVGGEIVGGEFVGGEIVASLRSAFETQDSVQTAAIHQSGRRYLSSVGVVLDDVFV